MNKSIKLKEQALEVIETLIVVNFPMLSLNTSPEKGKFILDKIYRMAHAAADTSCKHKEWEEEIKETYLEMKKCGLL